MKNLQSYCHNIWVVSNERILYRVFRGFTRALLLRKNTLKIIELFPTMACNLHCKMCSVSKFNKVTRTPLDLQHYQQIAKEGARLGAIAANILGGEPLLAPNIDQIIAIFKNEGFFTNVISNGTLATAERLAQLHGAGLDRICFSLDSMDEDRNDAVKGRGHFKKVFEALRLALKEGLRTGLAPVFFPNEVENAAAVVRYCRDHKLHASGGQVSPVGNWEGMPVMSPQEHDRVRELVKEYGRLSFDWALSYFLKMRCPAGKEKTSVQTNGDVTGCSINPIAFGNVREEPLDIIVKRMQVFSQFSKDSPVCLAAEDYKYIEDYLRPLSGFNYYPVHYRDHPRITPQNEPGLFA